MLHYLLERGSIDQGPSKFVLTPRVLTAWCIPYILTEIKAGHIYLSSGFKSYGWHDTSKRAVTVQAYFSPPDAVANYLFTAQQTTAGTLYDASPFNRDPLGTFEEVMKRYGPVDRHVRREAVRGDSVSWQCPL
jgi:hypothetical protein